MANAVSWRSLEAIATSFRMSEAVAWELYRYGEDVAAWWLFIKWLVVARRLVNEVLAVGNCADEFEGNADELEYTLGEDEEVTADERMADVVSKGIKDADEITAGDIVDDAEYLL